MNAETQAKIKKVMQGGTVVFESKNDTRIFSLDLAHQKLLECPKFTGQLLEMGLQGKPTTTFIDIETLKLITDEIQIAVEDWEFEATHPC